MCGIAGFTFASQHHHDRILEADALRRMVAALHHRGPEEMSGRFCGNVALGHTRLAIVDIADGQQPMRDPGTGVTVVFNGEVFNHVELRRELSPRYEFRTRCDTEVILAAYLVRGVDCVEDFNGQFAFALHDPRDGSLHFARDRYGKRPLFYAWYDAGLCFASEAKALFASGKIAASLDPFSLWETLHQWAPTDERSMFVGVQSLPPASVATLTSDGQLSVRRYWRFDLADERVDHGLSEQTALDELGELIEDAVRLRLRADVPVAAYLSGGLDSSLLCAVAQRQLGGTLQTFSVGFDHERYDERAFQHSVASALATEHHSVRMGDAEIGELLPQVVDHAENVLVRSAPAPMFKLSELVHASGTKVVLTGEGADEILGGYDLFKEMKIRQFWSRRPDSAVRPALLQRLYPYLAGSARGPLLTREFYGVGIEEPDAFDFSHRIRWTNSGRIGRFLASAVLEQVGDHDPTAALLASVPSDVLRWRPLARAQYLEVRTLLSQYLLSSQGDRMLMAHSVEGRFPFLDHRLADFSARLPDWLKLRGLKEKYLLKRFASTRVPDSVIARPKFPYRAPIAEAIVGPYAPTWSRELLTRDAVDAFGMFDGSKVERLITKLDRRAGIPTEADNMAVIAVATTQLLARRFLSPWSPAKSLVDAVELEGV